MTTEAPPSISTDTTYEVVGINQKSTNTIELKSNAAYGTAQVVHILFYSIYLLSSSIILKDFLTVHNHLCSSIDSKEFKHIYMA